MNEDESRKTIADEIKTCPLCGGRVFWFPISNYWGCENCKNTFNRYTVFPDEVKKTSAVGNAAAMREVLMRFLIWAQQDLWENACEGPNHRQLANAIVNEVSAALSAPPRQCDAGTPEEQTQRMLAQLCYKQKSCYELPSGEHCPLYRTGVDCRLMWAQMPYKAEEGDAK